MNKNHCRNLERIFDRQPQPRLPCGLKTASRRFKRHHPPLAAFFCVALAATIGWLAQLPPAQAADAPQWGFSFSRNMVSGEQNLPSTFDLATGRHVKWKTALGTESYSTPVIARGRVLIGTNNGQPRDPRRTGDLSVLMCFDEKDGRFQWQLTVPKLTTSIFWDWPNAGICSTATVENDRVYIVSNRGEVLCLDLEAMADGNDGPFQDEAQHAVPPGVDPLPTGPNEADILWKFDMIAQCGVRQHDQAHSSILVHGPYLYVNTSNGVDDSHRRIDAPNAPSLIVLEKQSGRWVARDQEQIGPRIFHSTWSSPALGQVNDHPVIIFAGGDGIVYGFEPLGLAPPQGQIRPLKKIWQFDCDPGAPKQNVQQYNGNRRVSPTNIKGIPVFHDGRIYVAAGGDVWWGKNEAWLKCIKPTGPGDITQSGAAWSYPLQRHCMSTPSVQNGLVYIADCGYLIHCLDAATGRPFWTHETKGEIWSSTLVADGKVYAGTRRGDFWVLAAAKEKTILHSAQFDSPIHGSPVAANGVLYVATMKYLYALANH